MSQTRTPRAITRPVQLIAAGVLALSAAPAVLSAEPGLAAGPGLAADPGPVPAVGLAAEPAQTQAAEEPTGPQVLRYVRAREGGLTARNLYDVKAVPIMEVSAGTLMAVYDERGPWLEVEVPGGFPVWVFGRYLRPTGQPDVYEVTHNSVLLRPAPGREDRNLGFPLGQRLQAGDRVTVIGVDGGGSIADADLSRTWVNIWSPPGAGAWIQESRTEALGSNDDGAALWAAAESALFEAALARSIESGAVEATAPAGGAAAVEPASAPGTPLRAASTTDGVRAREALAAARELLAREREKPIADWTAVRLALSGVLELGPDAATEAAARNELEKVDLLAELAQVKALQLQRDKEQREALLRRNEDIWSRIEASFPLYGRFEQRGVLERFRSAGGVVSYHVVRAGEIQAELISRSGRYDLELFVGAEIGVRGEGLGIARLVPGVPQVDVTRLEVLTAPR